MTNTQVQTATKSPILANKSTNPNYAKCSGLMLEVKFEDSEHFTKLRTADAYVRGNELPVSKQIENLETCRDEWRSNGQTKYFQAEYRIGQYKIVGGGYVWVPSHLLQTATI